MDLICETYLETPPASPIRKFNAAVSVSSATNKRKIDYATQQQVELLFGDDLTDFGAADCGESGTVLSALDCIEEKRSSPDSTKRNRLSLFERKFQVERYLCYIDKTQTNCQMDDDQLMRTFIEKSNSLGIYLPMKVSCLSRWVDAYRRGEYDLLLVHKRGEHSKTVAGKNNVVRQIDKHLNACFPRHARFNQIDWSPSLPKEYGVIAREFTPSGTFLGFYKGTVLTADENRSNRNHAYTFAIGRNLFIDTSAFLSCFARYYNCATNPADQNVAVELLSNWENPQKAICFIANRDIAQGEEFLVSYSPEYWSNMAKNLPRKSKLLKVCAKLSDKAGYSLLNSLYSIDAPILAANFSDDQLDSGDNFKG